MLSCKLLSIGCRPPAAGSRLSATGFQLKFLLSAYARVSGLGNRDWGASNRKPIARSRKPILGFGTGDSEAEKGDSGADSWKPTAGSQQPAAAPINRQELLFPLSISSAHPSNPAALRILLYPVSSYPDGCLKAGPPW